MGAVGWWDEVLGEEFLRGDGKLSRHNPPVWQILFLGNSNKGLKVDIYYIGFYRERSRGDLCSCLVAPLQILGSLAVDRKIHRLEYWNIKI